MSSIPPPADTPAPDAAATFCATLADEWIRCGVRYAMVAPGSRSTPLVLALADRPELMISVFHDERAAGFAALGVGLSTGMPAIVVCSSGTAGAHLHAAVIEAHQSGVPMIVCTADRPVELRGVGAPQTIDQTHLFGRSVRWFFEPGVADHSQRDRWRSFAARAVIDATSPMPGAVHFNLAFREPLLGAPGPLPEPRDLPWHIDAEVVTALTSAAAVRLSAQLRSARGVIIAGRGVDDPGAVHAFAARIGWPVLADPRSGCRTPAATTIAAYDSLLRSAEFAAEHRPDAILRLGEPPASKVLAQWAGRSGATQIQIGPYANWIDPDHTIATRVVARPGLALACLDVESIGGTRWLENWAEAEAAAQKTLGEQLGDGRRASLDEALTEPGVARTVAREAPDGAALVVSSSMPVRDVEWYGAPRCGLDVYSNRGANGIDGVVSTAIGVALSSGGRTVLLIGDVALLHDASALTALAQRHLDLTIVCVDNDGGGIFSFLPQGSDVPRARFEQLFGTPHGTDLVALVRAHGLDAELIDSYAGLTTALDRVGTSVVVVRTDRLANVAVHERIHDAVVAAIASLEPPPGVAPVTA